MNLLCKIALGTYVTAALPCLCQTLRLSGSVRTGQAYRHPIGHELLLEVTTDGMRVRRDGSVGEDDQFQQCVNTPVYGPKNWDFQATDFDRERGKEALGVRRSFHFVLNAAAEEAECEELRSVIDPNVKDNNWYSHPMGRAAVTLSHVELSGPASDSSAEVQSFRFIAVVKFPRTMTRLTLATKKPASDTKQVGSR